MYCLFFIVKIITLSACICRCITVYLGVVFWCALLLTALQILFVCACMRVATCKLPAWPESMLPAELRRYCSLHKRSDKDFFFFTIRVYLLKVSVNMCAIFIFLDIKLNCLENGN